MPGWVAYSWAGQPIHDIERWARERGEQFVQYRASRTVPIIGSFGAKLVEEVEEGEMPASFYELLGWTNGWRYQELGRRDPVVP